MICRRYAQPFLVAGSLALAFAGAACGSDSGNSSANRPIGTTGAADQRPADKPTPAAMTVTGCLQKTGGLTTDYILTERINTSPVGTHGASAPSGKVEAEEEKAAEHSYRLSGN